MQSHSAHPKPPPQNLEQGPRYLCSFQVEKRRSPRGPHASPRLSGARSPRSFVYWARVCLAFAVCQEPTQVAGTQGMKTEEAPALPRGACKPAGKPGVEQRIPRGTGPRTFLAWTEWHPHLSGTATGQRRPNENTRICVIVGAASFSRSHKPIGGIHVTYN